MAKNHICNPWLHRPVEHLWSTGGSQILCKNRCKYQDLPGYKKHQKSSCGSLFCICAAIFLTVALSVTPCTSTGVRFKRFVYAKRTFFSSMQNIQWKHVFIPVRNVLLFPVHGTFYKLKRSRSVLSFDHRDTASKDFECGTCFKLRGTLWLFNIAIENGPFIVDFPIKTSIYKGFSMAMSVIPRW